MENRKTGSEGLLPDVSKLRLGNLQFAKIILDLLSVSVSCGVRYPAHAYTLGRAVRETKGRGGHPPLELLEISAIAFAFNYPRLITVRESTAVPRRFLHHRDRAPWSNPRRPTFWTRRTAPRGPFAGSLLGLGASGPILIFHLHVPLRISAGSRRFLPGIRPRSEYPPGKLVSLRCRAPTFFLLSLDGEMPVQTRAVGYAGLAPTKTTEGISSPPCRKEVTAEARHLPRDTPPVRTHLCRRRSRAPTRANFRFAVRESVRRQLPVRNTRLFRRKCTTLNKIYRKCTKAVLFPVQLPIFMIFLLYAKHLIGAGRFDSFYANFPPPTFFLPQRRLPPRSKSLHNKLY